MSAPSGARLRREFGTTLPRFHLLAQLDAAESSGVAGLAMTELSRRMMVTNGNLTGLVARLAADGRVRRAASPDDRGVQLVRLTSRGRAGLHRMAPRHHEWVAGLFAGMPAADRDRLHELLGSLRTSIRAAAPSGTDA